LYILEPAACDDAYLMRLGVPDAIPTTFTGPIDEQGEPAVPQPLQLATLSLPVVHNPGQSQLETNVNFPRDVGSVIAGRYQITGSLGSGSFSHAVQCRDLADTQAGDVCVKIVRNNKDFFDQSLSEIKILQMLNQADHKDAHGVLRINDFFYHRQHRGGKSGPKMPCRREWPCRVALQSGPAVGTLSHSRSVQTRPCDVTAQASISSS